MSALAAAPGNSTFKDKEKPAEVRRSNVVAACAVADSIRTSLGPKGMDKMLQTKNGEVIISNDGHTIMQHMAVMHPAARMLVELSGAQDSAAGDGTTSVVVIAGALLAAAERLLNRDIHPGRIARSFEAASARAVEIMRAMAVKVDLRDRRQLVQAAATSLSSKIVAQHSAKLAPMCVDAVLSVVDPKNMQGVDIADIRLIKKLGGTIEDTELINGLVLRQPAIKSAGGPTRIERARIALIQFQLSPPKPDLENHVVVSDYRQMDKILKEERQYLLNIVKTIKKYKCNVLLIQKSILRDAVNEMALHFLAKVGILVVKDIERAEVEFISKSLGCTPIADIESFSEERLGNAMLVEEVEQNEARFVKITGAAVGNSSSAHSSAGSAVSGGANQTGNSNSSGAHNSSGTGGNNSDGTASGVAAAVVGNVITGSSSGPRTCSIVCRGTSVLVLDETERSIHDALCVVQCLVKDPHLVAGGGAPEIEVARLMAQEADALAGVEALCWREFADALEVIPRTLAENAGVNSTEAVTELRNRHLRGETTTGISVRRGTADITAENVFQPVLVNVSAITLASECVKSILRIDDIQFSR